MIQTFTSLVCLNWNELHVSKDTVRIALKEPEIGEVIVVDNGSTDGSKEHFSAIDHPKFHFISLPENRGSSYARNEGIDLATGHRIFLIDGDILYVRGTVAEYNKIMDMYPDAGCVGQHNHRHMLETSHNGVYNIADADTVMPKDYTVEDWFPMAWTQYGLFDGEVLREIGFDETPPFNEPGYGFEDDMLYNEMAAIGKSSLSVTAPTYYHHAHGAWRELYKAKVDDKYREREAYFRKKFGRTWSEKLDDIHAKTTRRNPNSTGTEG